MRRFRLGVWCFIAGASLLVAPGADAGATKFTKKMNEGAAKMVQFPLTALKVDSRVPYALVQVRYPESADAESLARLVRNQTIAQKGELEGSDNVGNTLNLDDQFAKTAFYAQEMYSVLRHYLPPATVTLVPGRYEARAGVEQSLFVTDVVPPPAVITVDLWAYSILSPNGCSSGTCLGREFEISVSLTTPRRMLAASGTTVNRVSALTSTVAFDCHPGSATVIDSVGTVCGNPLYERKLKEMGSASSFGPREPFTTVAPLLHQDVQQHTILFTDEEKGTAATPFHPKGAPYDLTVLPVFWSVKAQTPPAGWPTGSPTWNGLLPRYVGLILHHLRALDHQTEVLPAYGRAIDFYDAAVADRIAYPRFRDADRGEVRGRVRSVSPSAVASVSANVSENAGVIPCSVEIDVQSAFGSADPIPVQPGEPLRIHCRHSTLVRAGPDYGSPAGLERGDEVVVQVSRSAEGWVAEYFELVRNTRQAFVRHPAMLSDYLRAAHVATASVEAAAPIGRCFDRLRTERWIRGLSAADVDAIFGIPSQSSRFSGDARLVTLREILITERDAYADASNAFVETSLGGEFGARMQEVFAREVAARKRESRMAFAAIFSGVVGGVVGAPIWSSAAAFNAAQAFANRMGSRIASSGVAAGTAVVAAGSAATAVRSAVDSQTQQETSVALSELRLALRSLYREQVQGSGEVETQ